MKTKTITLYEYDELPDEIKAKVLENERYINVDDSNWSKWTLEEWEEKLEAMGFDNPEISYCGFSSQGDGASFTCKDVDVEAFITTQKARGRFKNTLKAISKFGNGTIDASVYRIDHHYSHENTVRATVEVDSYNPNYEKRLKEGDELESFITKTVRELSREIYRDLEKEYDGLVSDKAVIDTIKINEYTFTITGKMENA